MDIHGENSFKSKSYASAAFAIEKLPVQLTAVSESQIPTLKGIGSSTAQKISELLKTGKIKSLEEIIQKTPPGVIEMLNIKGIGPKKIHTIWKEMDIESIGELLYACKENRLKLYKGFGEKTQQNVIDTIEFYFKNKGSHLYAQVALIASEVTSFLKKVFPASTIIQTGAYIRQLEIVDELAYIITAPAAEIEQTMLTVDGFAFLQKDEHSLLYSTSIGINVQLFPANSNNVTEKIIATSSSQNFYDALIQKAGTDFSGTETGYFEKAGIPFIAPLLREDPAIIGQTVPPLIQTSDIKGIIHSHSNWSDGSNTIEEMAKAAIQKGWEYLVISDHSKTAFYAQGLSEEKIREQHRYIDELNEALAPFRIFKSIESDILNDGSLDYADDVLASFDLVIASVHSNLKMTEEKAMMRLMNAIQNPFTTILGHMTGRLLLSRPGYPVNHTAIIDACAQHQVVIELNAHPNRLDIDWRHIRQALDKNVRISIDPDAHSIEGMNDIQYGVLVAQKGMVTTSNNLSSFSRSELEDYLFARKKSKGI